MDVGKEKKNPNLQKCDHIIAKKNLCVHTFTQIVSDKTFVKVCLTETKRIRDGWNVETSVID